MNQPALRYDRRKAVAYTTLDRPDRLDAVDGAMLETSGAAFAAWANDDSVRDHPLPARSRQ
jgi:enoyl-CoA hydratase/carnithine racemase